MSPGSFEAALRAAGGALYAVDEVMTGKAKNAFVAVRPPGHHAETARPMGFCLFNNVAIAARYAQEQHGAERVAIVDFDVHHGNGSQEIFWADPTVMYCSTHQMPLYPGTGARHERGEHDNIVNAPLRAGDGGDAIPRGVRNPHPAAAQDVPARISSSSRPASTRTCAIRSPISTWSRPDFAWATAAADGDRRPERRRPRGLACSKAATICEGLAHSVAAHVDRPDAGLELAGEPA